MWLEHDRNVYYEDVYSWENIITTGFVLLHSESNVCMYVCMYVVFGIFPST